MQEIDGIAEVMVYGEKHAITGNIVCADVTTVSPLDSSEDETKWTSVLDIVSSVKTRLENHNEIEEDQIYRWTDKILMKPEQIDLVTRINAELERRPPRFSAEGWAKEL